MLPEVAAQNQLAADLEKAVAGSVADLSHEPDGDVLYVTPSLIVPIAKHLRDAGFNRLSAITAVDRWPRDPRFEIVYFLDAVEKNLHQRFAARIRQNESIESVCRVWRAANWYEREVFDLFGVQFFNHPNLERILMPADWEGHPLRKDYPIHGNKYSYKDE